MNQPPRVCKETQAGLADDELGTERAALHRARCADCAAHEARIQSVRDHVLLTDTALGAPAKARILEGLSEHFDAQAQSRGRRPFPWLPAGGARWMLGAVAVAAIVLIALVLRRPSPEPGLLVVSANADALESLETLLNASQTSLRAHPKQRLTARWGLRGRIALVGPGRISGARADALTLHSGALVVSSDPQMPQAVHYRGLELRAEDAWFVLSDTPPEGPSISVRRGSVTVHRGGGQLAKLGAGQRFSVTSKRTSLLDPTRAAQLFDPQERTLDAAAPSGALILDGRPKGTTVLINDRPMGQVPLALRLPEGQTKVKLQAPGHAAVVLSTKIRKNQSTPLSFELSPLPAPQRPEPVKPPPTAIPEPPAAPKPKPVLKPRIKPSAESLYQAAEAALGQRDPERARTLLAKLVKTFPRARQAQMALYELARLSYDQGRLSEASDHLEELLSQTTDRGLHESALYLRCRLQVEQKKPAIGCLEAFRRKFPVSVRDEEMLTVLIRSVESTQGCKATLPLLEEHARRYPKSAHRRELDALKERCR